MGFDAALLGQWHRTFLVKHITFILMDQLDLENDGNHTFNNEVTF
jgi:hypothetical protein